MSATASANVVHLDWRRAADGFCISPEGFAWLSHDDVEHSVFAFVRRARDGAFVVAVCNFTPVVRHGYRLGVPAAGRYREVINTDNAVYGGSGVGNGVIESEAMDWQGQAQSLVISVPPLGTVMWVLE